MYVTSLVTFFGLLLQLAHPPLASAADLKKSSVDPKLGTELTERYETYIQETEAQGPSAPGGEKEYIAVDISFTSPVDNAEATDLLRSATSVDFIECFATMCSTRIPVRALPDISNLDSVQLLRSVQATTNIGSVTSEGDLAMFSDLVRTKYAVNGSGLLIGVLSDSYNSLGGAASDIASGDLPSGADRILVLSDLSLTSGSDEGRAMMQLIYDVAPGARLAFHTAVRGQADFAAGIVQLADAGCDVIVDDIIYFAEPMFQDGIIAQAVDQVVSQGIPYFSAAGNSARKSWIAPTGFNPVTINSKVYHQFGTDSNGSPITFLRIGMQGNSNKRTFIIQWDETFASVSGPPGSRSDLDFALRIGNSTLVRTANNIGFDPVEVFQFAPSDYSNNATVTAELSIESFSGPLPTYMKLVVFGQVTSFEFDTKSSTSYGHANAAQCAGVGAARYSSTPAFGVSPPIIESFSSAGGTPILFTKTGTRLSSPEIRNQPRFTGPDGGATTFFGNFSSGVYRFFGTSAAAPHVAAVAALMLQYKGGNRSLTPAQIYSTLANTAIDMDDLSTVGFDVGFDFGTGSGLVNASAAFNALAPLSPVPAPNAPVPIPGPTAPIPVPAPTVPIPVPAPTVPIPLPAPTVPIPVLAPNAPVPVPAPKSPTEAPSEIPTESPTEAPSEIPTESPTEAPSEIPTAAPFACVITYNLFNSKTDAFVAALTNGTTVVNPPPCKRLNIEAVIPCGVSENAVTMELFRGSRRVKRSIESLFPYFLFGNKGANVKDGKIPHGSYGIRILVDGIWSPFTNFTMGGTCS
jgi:Subtilase family